MRLSGLLALSVLAAPAYVHASPPANPQEQKNAPAPVAVPPPEPPTANGSLSQGQINSVIHANRAQIWECYERELANAPDLNGKLEIKIVIAASGTVSSATVVQSTTQSPELDGCVANTVAKLTFPKPQGGVVVVTYPFVFKPSKGRESSKP